MDHCTPHFQLFSESNAEDQPGRWRFVIQSKDNGHAHGNDSADGNPFEAGGTEEDVRGERLELLCVVRGLEAMDQPSHVTLITSSVYVREGIRYGLRQWRANDWQWESFGRMVPVKNRDLWHRVDSALQFHRLDCRVWRLDAAHEHGAEHDLTENTVINKQTANPQRPASWSLEQIAGVYLRLKRKMMRCLLVLRRRIFDGVVDLKYVAGVRTEGGNRGGCIQTESTLAENTLAGLR